MKLLKLCRFLSSLLVKLVQVKFDWIECESEWEGVSLCLYRSSVIVALSFLLT